MFGLFKLIEHHVECVVAERKILRLGVPVAGKAAGTEIGGKIPKPFRQLFARASVSTGGEVFRLRQDVVVAADHQPVAKVGFDVDIQDQTKDGQNGENEKPRELDGRVVVVSEEEQHDRGGEQRAAAPEIGEEALQIAEAGKQKQDLDDQRHNDDAGAAEYDLDQLAFAFSSSRMRLSSFSIDVLSQIDRACGAARGITLY